ncbi:sugar phosphate isomerase/epimerase [Methylobacterium sp. J-043]|nr:sugar phosphate isomerase/epimerase [Methylobacterium sp. J-043]
MNRLSVSNIAWSASITDRVYASLADANVAGVEVAPTKLAPWQNLTEEIARVEGRRISRAGLQVSSYQALYFERPDCQLLGDATSFEAMREHTVRVAIFAEHLSRGGAGVFGAPRNRQRGQLTVENAFELGAQRFRCLAEAVAATGFIIALEAAPNEYGGDFLETTAQCAAMVRAVNHPSFRLHIDSGCLAFTEEDIQDIIREHHDIIAHVHLSKPKLAPITRVDAPLYAPLISVLTEVEYVGWTAIEMRETDDSLSNINEAILTLQLHGSESD